MTSRRRLSPGATCYLCGKSISADDPWNRDHVPPLRFFAKPLRTQFHVQLEWLPTHKNCNTSYQQDEAYFVVSFVGHLSTQTARAVMGDIGRGVSQGHEVGLVKDVIGRFGRVEGPNGEVLYAYDANRARRVIWKIARGLYRQHLDRNLPEDRPLFVKLMDPARMEEAMRDLPWFHYVRDTAPLGRYGAVFDYKWICIVEPDKGRRGHVMAMLFWDRLIVALLFHDPGCACEKCRPSSKSTSGETIT
jgi:hypothetical protein